MPPLGMAETSGLGRLGAKNAVLDARVQVLNPVPPTCYVGQLPSECGGASVLVRLDDPWSGAWSLKHILMSFQVSWSDIQV